MAAIVAAWPGAVGDAVARNAWPATLARDGTLHVSTSSSAWAFELTQLRGEVLPRLQEGVAGEAVVSALRFAPGRLPAVAMKAPLRPPSPPGRPIRRPSRRPSAWPRRLGTKRCEISSPEPLRQAFRGPGATGRSARLSTACKWLKCRHFLMAEAAYTAKDITVLEGLEPVRLRPGHVHRLDRAPAASITSSTRWSTTPSTRRWRDATTYVEVTLHPDNSVTVRDAGAGIPVEVIPEQGLSALTVVLTKLHAGGKFGGDGYKVSGGLHGVGVSVVNALSEWLVAEVHRDGKSYRQEFARGEPTTEMLEIGAATDTGTTITLPARRRDLRGDRVVARHARAAAPRDRVPHEGPADRPDRRAGGRDARRVLRRGRHPRLRRVRERRQGPRPQARRLLRGRAGRRRRRGRHAVERVLRRVRLLVRQQHQHARGRRAPDRLQGGAHGAR